MRGNNPNSGLHSYSTLIVGDNASLYPYLKAGLELRQSHLPKRMLIEIGCSDWPKL